MKKVLRLFTVSLFLLCSFKQAKAQDTITFEVPSTDIFINPDSGNLWQIGKPHKVFFSSAHHGSKAIITDTLNTYPPNDTSSFIYTIHKPLIKTCVTCMSFSQKYDLDTLGDKGIIEASYDGGTSWLIVKDTTGVFSPTWGQSIFMWNGDIIESNGNWISHNLIISGKSNGWIRSEFCWQWWLPMKSDTIIFQPDSLMIRFTFISDSTIKNKDGWMIDDIFTYLAGLPCSGIEENALDTQILVSPNPFSSSTQITLSKTYHNILLSVYDIQGKLVTQYQYKDSDKIILNRNELNNGLYFLKLILDEKEVATGKVIVGD